MSKKDNIVYMLFIILITLLSFTGCLINVGDGSYNPGNDTEIDSGSNEAKNLIVNIDFDNNFTHKIEGTDYRYTYDEVFAKRNENPSRARNVLREEHGKVCELKGKGWNNKSYFQISFSIRKKSVLNFQIKSDMYSDDVLRLEVAHVNVDCKEYKIHHKGNGDTWKKVSMELEPGQYTVKWYIKSGLGYSPQLENVIYIDNITVVEDKLQFIDIYPKGQQETYVGGMPIKFTAVPLRGDRSVIENKEVIYSVDGCGTIDSNGLFKPTGKGKCTITASVDGKYVNKTDVIVHGKNYLSDPVNIGGYDFTGRVSLGAEPGTNLDTKNTKYDYGFNETPMGVNFNADGFFVLKGHGKVPLWIRVLKDGTKYVSNFFVREPGDFYKRIWLRFGKGDYVVEIWEAYDLDVFKPADSKYEGDISKLSGCNPKILHVKNTSQISEEDALYIMPSEVVQSDSFYVSNVANSILGDLPRNATTGDKLKAFHNWELYNHHYDMVSVNHPDQRKRQDAEHVIKYGMGVCEGYANLYAALVRKAGIPAKVMCDSKVLMHAWNQILYDDGKWYLTDVTWDDPVTDSSDSYNDKAPGREIYTYFMTSITDDKHTYEGEADIGRSLQEETLPEMTGLPDGWY